MEPLDPQLRQLIDEGLPAAVPDDDAHDRGLAALVAHIEGAPPPVPPAAPATAGLTKLVVGIAAVGAVATGGWVATRPAADPIEVSDSTPSPTTSRTAPPKPTAPAEPAVVSPRVDNVDEAPVQEPRPVPVNPSKPPRRGRPAKSAPPAETPAVSIADKLRAEADLIARAESALDRGKPREAVALCDFHRKDYDSPQLATERNAIAASAACMIEASDTAAAEAFLRAHPKSALAKKVRQRCGLGGVPNSLKRQ
jgi:hypothetical protein